MRAVIELDFASAEEAAKAEKLLERKELNNMSKITLSAKGKKVVAIVTAERFALLRARITGLMRNARIVYDSIELVSKK